MIKVVYATVDAPVQLASGISGHIRKGTHWPADDPVVQAHPEWFSGDPRYGLHYSEEPEGYDQPVVETATAGPGERRSTRRAT